MNVNWLVTSEAFCRVYYIAGIGFAGQGYARNKDDLSQKNRRAGYGREKNYIERIQLDAAKTFVNASQRMQKI